MTITQPRFGTTTTTTTTTPIYTTTTQRPTSPTPPPPSPRKLGKYLDQLLVLWNILFVL